MSQQRRTSVSAGHRPLMGPPETPSRMMQPSPNLFPSLQFSPDLFAHSPYGPATAPIYPQQRLFWDPASSAPNVNVSPELYGDSFVLNQDELQQSFRSSSTIVPNQPISESIFDQSYHMRADFGLSAGAYMDSSTFPSTWLPSPRVPSSHNEHPGMFLSSPARRFGGGDPEFARPIRPTLEGSALQSHAETSTWDHGGLFQFRKDDDLDEAPGNGQNKRPLPLNDTSRPNLKRSLTHTGVAPQRLRRPADEINSSQFVHNSRMSSIKRVPSPVKSVSSFRSSRSHLLPRPSSRNRSSLSLAIDENGVAKTIRTDMSQSADEMDLDDRSSVADITEDERDDFDMLQSQSNLSAFKDHNEYLRPAQRAVRQNIALQKDKTRSVMASKSSSIKPWRGNSSHMDSKEEGVLGLAKGRRQGLAMGPLPEQSHPAAGLPNHGDAKQALRAIMQDRSSSSSSQSDSLSNLRSSSSVHFNSSPPVQQTRFGTFDVSPTTITDPELGTPSTDRESVASIGSTRCICNSSYVEGLVMIQCDSCSKWLHAACIGLEGRKVPEVYVCVYCAQTPMRYGRIRDSARVAFHGSPLAYKSHKQR